MEARGKRRSGERTGDVEKITRGPRWVIPAALTLILSASALAGSDLLDLGSAPDFTLIDQNGGIVTKADLAGRVWIADFIFTRCARCAGVSSKLTELSDVLPEDVVFVSFSLDPSYDSGAVLADYAQSLGKQGREWRFLTGSETEIHRLTRDGFHLAVDRDISAGSPSEAIVHSLRFAMIDGGGRIRAYFDSEDVADLRRVRSAAYRLLHPPAVVALPAVNAALNFICAMLLINGFVAIRRGRVSFHKRCMLAAFCVSTVFLASYLYYHFQVGSVRFQSQGTLRPVYFSILVSHTILAAVNVPLILITIFLGLTERFERHRKFARVTFPSWLYVSVTGVLIYWLLYHYDVS